MTARRPSAKECRKRFIGGCFFCGERDYALLHGHRIEPAERGGKYHWDNILPACPTCHTKIHTGRIVVHGRHPSSAGVWVVHYTEDGVERWEGEDRWRNRQRRDK